MNIRATGIFFIFCIFSSKSIAQDAETTRSFAYDRGLVNFSEPYAPAGNPALLILRNYFRFNLEYHKTTNNYYNVSISYPLSSLTGLGLSWFSSSSDQVQTHSSGIFETQNKKQTFLLSLGHDYPILWGQQLEVDFELNRFSSLHLIDADDVPYLNDQKITCLYRIGFYKQFFDHLSIGFLSSPIFNIEYHIFDETDRSSETNFSFWKETESTSKLPLIAVQWYPFSKIGFVLSNRSKTGRNDVQLASELKFNRLTLTSAICKDQNLNDYKTIFGIGGNLWGFDIFSAYDLREKEFRMAVSFAPERFKDLVEVQNVQIPSLSLYPYRLKYGNPNYLTKISLNRLTNDPVEITVKLTGHRLPSISKKLVLDEIHSSIEIPIPTELISIDPGTYHYNIDIIAYCRGKQVIERQFAFEMKDEHDWSGNPQDLVYFVASDDNKVCAESRRLISLFRNKKNTQDAIQIAECFYNFIQDSLKYIPDPRPIRIKQDRVQYPTETLISGTGDCEDLSILMISLLQSVGIEASFVEFVLPESEEGHVFILFDSQKDISESVSDHENLQKYIIRNYNKLGSKLFVPLEITKSELTFEQAWLHALGIYHKLAMKQKGLARGWFNIIDM